MKSWRKKRIWMSKSLVKFKAFIEALIAPPRLGYDCPICGEYVISDDLRYHPSSRDDSLQFLKNCCVPDLLSFA